MLDVICASQINLDKFFYVNKFANPGEEYKILDTYFAAGGSGANTLSALAKLGFKTAIIGAVGTDSDGDFLLEETKRFGTDTTYVKRFDGRSNAIYAFVDPSGERVMYFDVQVGKRIREIELDLDFVNRYKYFYLATTQVRKYLPEIKAKICYAPGTIGVTKGKENIQDILEKTYALFINDEELQKLIGKNYIDGAKQLLEEGMEIVSVTLGKEGCHIFSKEGDFRVPTIDVPVVDKTGAGDAFSAGFIAGLLWGKPLKECAELGIRLSTFCIQKKGAREGHPTKEQLLGNV
ncbi:MAG: carbohydrate kinase family protein [Candidatus Diapherotrites archaeon]|nr:carbohydrate kinase family protein [Candidatus Diapherotrites archaeon]